MDNVSNRGWFSRATGSISEEAACLGSVIGRHRYPHTADNEAGKG